MECCHNVSRDETPHVHLVDVEDVIGEGGEQLGLERGDVQLGGDRLEEDQAGFLHKGKAENEENLIY